jgi:hypothetical protein
MDTRQNEALKIKGYGREIITRVQKLKKKAHLNTQDPVLVFYRFGENANYLNLAVDKEAKAIAAAIKKPFLNEKFSFGLVEIGQDNGTIEEEEYHLKLCAPGPVFNFE